MCYQVTHHTFYKRGKKSDVGRLPSSCRQVQPNFVQLLPQRSTPVFRLGSAGINKEELSLKPQEQAADFRTSVLTHYSLFSLFLFLKKNIPR